MAEGIPDLLFRWRWGIVSEHGPDSPTTRHVLLTLAIHMDSDGDRGFPSTRLLAKETGLSERAVIDHLALADALGWIKKASAGFTDKGWRKHKYEPLIPPNRGPKVLNQGKHQRTEPRSARHEKGAERPSKGAEPDDIKVLNEVQSNSTVNSTNNSTGDSEDFLFEGKTKKEEITTGQRGHVANPYDTKRCAVPEWQKPESWADTATRDTANQNLAVAFATIGRRRGHQPAATKPKPKRRRNGARVE